MTATTQTPEYEITVGAWGVRLHWQGQTFEIEVDDLDNGGWVHRRDARLCEQGDCDPCDRDHVDDLPPSAAWSELKRWHDEESRHAGPFKYCDEAPCRAIRTDLEELELDGAA